MRYDPSEGAPHERLIEPLAEPSVPEPYAPRIRLAIVTMTKRPSNFATWLRYHRTVCGVEHFFLRVEDTPCLENFLLEPPWSELCTVTLAQSTVRDWEAQTQRQMNHCFSAINRARAAGYTHLLHLDDDELLYLPSGADALHAAIARAPAGTADLHALTLEALAPSLECRNPFAECSAFRHCADDYCAYGGGPASRGKSFGVLSCGMLSPHGPHHFRQTADDIDLPERRIGQSLPEWLSEVRRESVSAGPTEVLPPPVAVILHYESCRYERWRDKFTDYARRMRHEGERAIAKARQFTKFYRDSITCCSQMLNRSREYGDAELELLGHFRSEDATDHARQLWCDLGSEGGSEGAGAKTPPPRAIGWLTRT